MRLGISNTRRGLVGAAAMLTVVAASLVSAEAARAATYSETVGVGTNTWSNYTNAGGVHGPTIPRYSTVQIACALNGFAVANGNTWWYRIAQSPWDNNFYASADAFYNNGQTSGSLKGTPWVDPAVPICGQEPPPPPPPPPPTPATVELAKGPAASKGFRYAITLRNFPANQGITVRCYDSVSPDGFYVPFTMNTDGSGYAFTQGQCFSGDGPDHWVVAGGVPSNHVSWGAGGGGGNPPGGGNPGGGQTGGGSGSGTPASSPIPSPSLKAERCAADSAGALVDSLAAWPDNDAPAGYAGYKISIRPGPKGKVSWYANNSKIADATTDMWNVVRPCMIARQLKFSADEMSSLYYQLNCHFYDQRAIWLPRVPSFGDTYDLETWRPSSNIPSSNIRLQSFYITTACNWK